MRAWRVVPCKIVVAGRGLNACVGAEDVLYVRFRIDADGTRLHTRKGDRFAFKHADFHIAARPEVAVKAF